MKFKLSEGVNPSKYLYHATYAQFLDSIKKNGLGNTSNKMWGDSKSGVVYLAVDPWVAESYAEIAEFLDDVEDADEYLDNIIILQIDVSKLDSSKLKVDENVLLDDEDNATWEYHGVIPFSACRVFSGGIDEGVRVDENVGDTAFSVSKQVYDACREVIKSYYLNPANTRGSRQARTLVISRYNKKFGTTLNPDDYLLHHRNGLHAIDDFENIVLLNKNAINHLLHHNEVIKATTLQYAKDSGYKTGQVVPPSLFTRMTILQKYKLLNLFLNISELKTDRLKNNRGAPNVIYDGDL